MVKTVSGYNVDFHYWYQRRWGGGLQYFQTRSDAGDRRYNTGAGTAPILPLRDAGLMPSR